MFNKFKSIFDNFLHDATHWSYSISFSLFIVGSLFLGFGTIENSTSVVLISCFFLVGGMFFFPNFKTSYIDIIAKGLIKFITACSFTLIDVLLITKIIINLYNNKENLFLFYFIVSIITFFLLRYYIDIFYKIISILINGTRKKSDIIKKVWKIVLTLLGFLITLASFVKLIIEIL